MQQKKYLSPKMAMLNVELELKAERDNAEVRVDNVQVCVSPNPQSTLSSGRACPQPIL